MLSAPHNFLASMLRSKARIPGCVITNSSNHSETGSTASIGASLLSPADALYFRRKAEGLESPAVDAVLIEFSRLIL